MALARLEHALLSKQLLEAEIDNQLSELTEHPMQLSLFILSGKDLQPSIHGKVHRCFKFTLDSQIFESKVATCEGVSQTATWNEAFLLPVKSTETCLKLVYIEQETSAKPLGGVVIKLSGFSDQKRHDGWYDLGCGKVRLALRFIHNAGLLLKEYLKVLSESILKNEELIEKSRFLEQDTRILRIYLKCRTWIVSRLVQDARSCRESWVNCLKKEDNREIALSEEGESEANNEDLESFIKKLDQEMKENISFPVICSKNHDSSLNFSNSDVPPYIEAAEKTCKRRIPIKRY
jgi:hypothetical protein